MYVLDASIALITLPLHQDNKAPNAKSDKHPEQDTAKYDGESVGIGILVPEDESVNYVSWSFQSELKDEFPNRLKDDLQYLAHARFSRKPVLDRGRRGWPAPELVL
jgi:hypothetical protein